MLPRLSRTSIALIFFAAVIAFSCLAQPAMGRSLKGVDFPESITIGGRECGLNGLGIRKKFFISVYIGALYIAEPSTDASTVIASDQEKRLIMHFLHSKVTSSQLKDAWTEGFQANETPGDEQIKELKEEFIALFDEDVHKGEVITITYRPGSGTEVNIKGKSRGVIRGADFMKAFFSIWFGKNPADKGLMKGMLGG